LIYVYSFPTRRSSDLWNDLPLVFLPVVTASQVYTLARDLRSDRSRQPPGSGWARRASVDDERHVGHGTGSGQIDEAEQVLRIDRLGRGHQLLACPPAELQQAALFDVRPHRVLEFDVLAGAEREVGLELTQGLLGEFEDFVARGQGADEFVGLAFDSGLLGQFPGCCLGSGFAEFGSSPARHPPLMAGGEQILGSNQENLVALIE